MPLLSPLGQEEAAEDRWRALRSGESRARRRLRHARRDGTGSLEVAELQRVGFKTAATVGSPSDAQVDREAFVRTIVSLLGRKNADDSAKLLRRPWRCRGRVLLKSRRRSARRRRFSAGRGRGEGRCRAVCSADAGRARDDGRATGRGGGGRRASDRRRVARAVGSRRRRIRRVAGGIARRDGRRGGDGGENGAFAGGPREV